MLRRDTWELWRLRDRLEASGVVGYLEGAFGDVIKLARPAELDVEVIGKRGILGEEGRDGCAGKLVSGGSAPCLLNSGVYARDVECHTHNAIYIIEREVFDGGGAEKGWRTRASGHVGSR